MKNLIEVIVDKGVLVDVRFSPGTENIKIKVTDNDVGESEIYKFVKSEDVEESVPDIMLSGTIVVDTKETIWWRQEFEIDEPMSLKDFLENLDILESTLSEELDGTDAPMSPEENNGQPTLEIYDDKSLLYDNVNFK